MLSGFFRPSERYVCRLKRGELGELGGKKGGIRIASFRVRRTFDIPDRDVCLWGFRHSPVTHACATFRV